jgi:hypothetical protein
MPENKTKATKVNVMSFIAALTDETRRADAKALVKLLQSVVGEKPKMWGPSGRYAAARFFAAQARHRSL